MTLHDIEKAHDTRCPICVKGVPVLSFEVFDIIGRIVVLRAKWCGKEMPTRSVHADVVMEMFEVVK
jgi:hypothetical protein